MQAHKRIHYLVKETENVIVFSVRSNFISLNEHQKQYFHDWRNSNILCVYQVYLCRPLSLLEKCGDVFHI